MWEHTEHQYGNWYPMAAKTEDDIKPDSKGDYYHYVRECNVMGCTAKQFAENLVPQGKVKDVPSVGLFIEVHAADLAYSDWPEGVMGRDVWREEAAKMFDIPTSQVTTDQKRAAKRARWEKEHPDAK